ncbi:hypothetical protein P8452_39419 [Trifolium repens]|nr:hypothetical protein P8452_39419 [Trifolium repens]
MCRVLSVHGCSCPLFFFMHTQVRKLCSNVLVDSKGLRCTPRFQKQQDIEHEALEARRVGLCQDIDMERLNKLAAFQRKGLQAYMSSPCHIELILSEKEEAVQKEPESQLATNKKKSQALRSGASS